MQRSLEAERRHSREVVHERDRSLEESAKAMRETAKAAEDARAAAAAADMKAQMLEVRAESALPSCRILSMAGICLCCVL